MIVIPKTSGNVRVGVWVPSTSHLETVYLLQQLQRKNRIYLLYDFHLFIDTTFYFSISLHFVSQNPPSEHPFRYRAPPCYMNIYFT